MVPLASGVSPISETLHAGICSGAIAMGSGALFAACAYSGANPSGFASIFPFGISGARHVNIVYSLAPLRAASKNLRSPVYSYNLNKSTKLGAYLFQKNALCKNKLGGFVMFSAI